MKTSPKAILPIAALVLGSVSFVVAIGDHDGHDHSGHDHSHEKKTAAVSSDSTEGFEVSDAFRNEIDLQTQEIEMREIEGADEAVIAIPKSSVVDISGKTYVFAQSEGSENTFERWEITTGASDDQFVEAVTGVFPGDRLVSNGSISVAQIQNGTYDAVANGGRPADNGTPEETPRTITESATTVADACPRDTACQFTRSRRVAPECDRSTSTVRRRFSNHGPQYGNVDEFHGRNRSYRGQFRDCPQPVYYYDRHHGW